ncbi:SCP-like protein [Ancylostoma caninum]|uniref:SCP-like protein n=1 Tax=Ancylostoma caninum TaxID=29170 RepID=A0A368GAR0_ANCCA|nr:SCP-like protein [Ancylostoma caninum]
MARLYINALTIISLLPALCEGVKPLCPDGYIDKATIDGDILKTVNERRQALIEGKQENGETGGNLPRAKGMTKVRWSCELEQTAVAALGETCVPQRRTNSKRLADFFHHDNDPEYKDQPGKILKNALNSYLARIDSHSLNVPKGATKVRYNGDKQLKTYANLVRSKNTEIGCAINTCSGFGQNSKMGEGAAMYCVLNSKDIRSGETIYEIARNHIHHSRQAGLIARWFTI